LKSRIVISAFFLFGIAGLFVFDSCKKQGARAITTPLNFVVPAGFPEPVYDFKNNPVTEEGFQLGKKLFYDGRLSIDGNFPCSSCHQPVAAFTTFEHDRSHGYNHSHTLRNAPGLANLAWYPAYRQDGSGQSLEAVSLAHMIAPDEMGGSIEHIISKMQPDTSYQRMFAAAYGNRQVTSDRILKSLSQFVVSLVSANSKYDQVKNGTASFSTEEQQGYAVFQANCSSCHREPLFSDFSYRNTGLPLDPALQDYGRMRVTGNHQDSLKFRVPSLRNVDLTSYYGHDGRFSVMRKMVQHYRFGIQQSSTIDPSLVNGLTLTDEQENNLIAFLRTLSDSSYITNPRYTQ
jgi:cytochrome c peroxidase